MGTQQLNVLTTKKTNLEIKYSVYMPREGHSRACSGPWPGPRRTRLPHQDIDGVAGLNSHRPITAANKADPGPHPTPLQPEASDFRTTLCECDRSGR